jgi:hypothetical protein
MTFDTRIARHDSRPLVALELNTGQHLVAGAALAYRVQFHTVYGSQSAGHVDGRQL